MQELPAFAYVLCRCGHEFWHHNSAPMGCQPRSGMQQHGPVTGLCECVKFQAAADLAQSPHL